MLKYNTFRYYLYDMAKTILEASVEMHNDLRRALACMDGCNKDDIRDQFLIAKIAEQTRLDACEAAISTGLTRRRRCRTKKITVSQYQQNQDAEPRENT